MKRFVIWYVFVPDGQETHFERVDARDENDALTAFWQRHNRTRIEVEHMEELQGKPTRRSASIPLKYPDPSVCPYSAPALRTHGGKLGPDVDPVVVNVVEDQEPVWL